MRLLTEQAIEEEKEGTEDRILRGAYRMEGRRKRSPQKDNGGATNNLGKQVRVVKNKVGYKRGCYTASKASLRPMRMGKRILDSPLF